MPAAKSSWQMMGRLLPIIMLGLDVEVSLRQASAAQGVTDSGGHASVCGIGDIGVVLCQVRHGVSTRNGILFFSYITSGGVDIRTSLPWHMSFKICQTPGNQI